MTEIPTSAIPGATNTPVTGIDEAAAVVVRRETRVAAPIDLVWKLHTDVDRWPDWQPDVATAQADGPLRPGSAFRWSTHGLDIVSTVHAVDEPRRILWGGPANGITGVHEWTFTADGDTTIVRTAESWDGEPVRADAENLRTQLDASLASWLEHLRRTAETRATTRRERRAKRRAAKALAWTALGLTAVLVLAEPWLLIPVGLFAVALSLWN